ncbi:MAG: hypothetical protein EBE86_017245 [Hormoscilla sp. GUM202]|nr:hypothetical protein [Hormoscilla sp. GUM202]
MYTTIHFTWIKKADPNILYIAGFESIKEGDTAYNVLQGLLFSARQLERAGLVDAETVKINPVEFAVSRL